MVLICAWTAYCSKVRYRLWSYPFMMVGRSRVTADTKAPVFSGLDNQVIPGV